VERLLASSSITIGFYFQTAVQFVQSLAHPSQPNAGLCTHAAQQPQAFFGYAFSKVSYLQNHGFGIMLKTDACLRSSGMAKHVGQAFL